MNEISKELSFEADQAGFADFFRAEYETLLRAMYLLTGDRYEAEERAQDALVKACERWDRVRRWTTQTQGPGYAVLLGPGVRGCIWNAASSRFRMWHRT